VQPGATVLLLAQDLAAIPTRPQREPPYGAWPPLACGRPGHLRSPGFLPAVPPKPHLCRLCSSWPACIPARRSRARARPEPGRDPHSTAKRAVLRSLAPLACGRPLPRTGPRSRRAAKPPREHETRRDRHNALTTCDSEEPEPHPGYGHADSPKPGRKQARFAKAASGHFEIMVTLQDKRGLPSGKRF
jgi:hypothetical protein